MSFEAYTTSGQGENKYQPLPILATRDPVDNVDVANPNGGPYQIDQKWFNKNIPYNYWRYQGSGIWVKDSDSTGPLLQLTVPLGTPVVQPNAAGNITYTSTAGTLDITGSLNTVNFDLHGGGTAIETLSDDAGTAVTPTGSPENIQLVGHVVEQGATKFSTVVAGSHLLNINPMSPARWIVDPLGFNGTHTTIGAAITAATAGDTIFVLPGTFSENLTLKAGVNITAFGSDSSLNQTGRVVISGKATLTTAGTVTISGIQIQTNADYLLAVTGSAASVVNLVNCNLNCTNHTGISYTSSSASSAINVNNCTGDLGTTGISFHTMTSSSGLLTYNFCSCTNTGSSLTASTNSASVVNVFYSTFASIFSTTSTGSIGFYYAYLPVGVINQTALTTAGTGIAIVQFCEFTSGTASAISIGAGTTATVTNTFVSSTNANVITGAGTLNYNGLTFSGTHVTINTTTQTGGLLQGGVVQAPSVGFIGEEIVSSVSVSSPVNVPTATTTNVTSMTITPGVWNVSCVCGYGQGGTVTGGGGNVSITSVSGGQGTPGYNNVYSPQTPQASNDCTLVIPPYQIVLTSNTTVYMTIRQAFTVGTIAAYGRLTATRIG